MKNMIALAMLCCYAMTLHAQQFTTKFELLLPDSIYGAKTDWVDVDNDGLLDVALVVENKKGEDYLMFVKGDTVSVPVLHALSRRVVDVAAYAWVDYNRDNAMDILISGTSGGSPLTVLYENKGGFRFDEVLLPMPAFSKSLFADLNNDARAEWIVTCGTGPDAYLLALSQNKIGQWSPLSDTVYMAATAIEIVDADRNGVHDLFVSGSVDTDSLFTGFLILQGDTAFVPYLGHSWTGVSAVADLNADGVMDIVFNGEDAAGQAMDRIWMSSASSYVLSNSPLPLKEASIFLADLDADGIIDYSLSGKSAAGDTLHMLRYAAQAADTLDTHQIACHAFGDAEHDGDLDVLQVVMRQRPVLRILENHAAVNHAPARPFAAVGIRIFNRTFVHWDIPADDHTPGKSLTYDVFFQTQGEETQVGDFDLGLDKRLLTGPGNNGTYNFKLLKDIAPGPFNYIVQAVDNSLHAGTICAGGGASACVLTEPRVIETCSVGHVQLPGSANTQWFSFATGYLGEFSLLQFESQAQDTVFSYDPAAGAGCDAVKTYIIQIEDTLEMPSRVRYACENAVIKLEADPAWRAVSWTSLLHGDLGSVPTADYLVHEADTVLLTGVDAQGCKIRQLTGIVPSIPQVAVAADKYKIVHGAEVQLEASGAERYLWTPLTGLDRADIADPVARPDTTTQYQVVGYDSLGCSAQAQVTIVVEGAMFIPNLFTPNGDGRNDQLKVYGPTAVTDFMLTISNREGSVVFRTTDITEASTRGWDGTDHGVKQPGGVYFWKVKGHTVDGGKLLLNGRESGSIVLIH